jgi:hypothetical protein
MRTFLLILTTVVLPLVWGWGVHRLLLWLWPVTHSASANRNALNQQLDALTDYQI